MNTQISLKKKLKIFTSIRIIDWKNFKQPWKHEMHGLPIDFQIILAVVNLDMIELSLHSMQRSD